MTVLKLFMLGPFRAEIRDRPLPRFRTSKVKALLIFLAAEQALTGRCIVHQRETLMALLWPDMPAQAAQNNLRQALFHLRHALKDSNMATRSHQEEPLVTADRLTVSMSPEAPWTADVAVLRSLTDQIQRHGHRPFDFCENCLERLLAVGSLYCGDFLSDFALPQSDPFEDWATLRREQLRQQALGALHSAAEVYLARGNFAEAEATARRQLAIDNMGDSATQQLMKALYWSGQRVEALKAFETYRHTLADELDAEPTGGTAALARAIRADHLGTPVYIA